MSTGNQITKYQLPLPLKKPFSLRQFQGSLNIKTPFSGFKTSSLEISHDAKDSLKSLVTVQVNKNSIRVDASAKKENSIDG